MKVAVVCDFPYWELSIGSYVRLDSICDALSDVVDLTVVSSKSVGQKYSDQVQALDYGVVDWRTLRKQVKVSKEELGKRLPGLTREQTTVSTYVCRYLEDKGFDVVVVPYLNRYWLVNQLPEHIVKVVDTIDCMSQRLQSFRAHSLTPSISMSRTQESKALSRFDFLLALSNDDLDEFNAMVEKPILVAPFLIPADPLYKSRKGGRNLLFVGAYSDPNNLALDFLLKQVLPLVPVDVNLYIVGNVYVPEVYSKNVKVHKKGLVEDIRELYKIIDVSLNPTYVGGGVKTKTLEALAYGVPVVCTNEAARGLHDVIPKELMANTKADFACCIFRLLKDHRLRDVLSKKLMMNYINYTNVVWPEKFVDCVSLISNRKKFSGEI